MFAHWLFSLAVAQIPDPQAEAERLTRNIQTGGLSFAVALLLLVCLYLYVAEKRTRDRLEKKADEQQEAAAELLQAQQKAAAVAQLEHEKRFLDQSVEMTKVLTRNVLLMEKLELLLASIKFNNPKG